MIYGSNGSHTPQLTIRRNLIAAGVDPAMPAAAVSCGTTDAQRSVLATLGTLAEQLEAEQIRPPAIIVIGEVVAVAEPEFFGRG